jgi:hypothetical protein
LPCASENTVDSEFGWFGYLAWELHLRAVRCKVRVSDDRRLREMIL